MSYLAFLCSTPAIFLALGFLLPTGRLRTVVGPLGLVSFVAWLLTQTGGFSAPERLLFASLWLLYFIKGWALLQVPREVPELFAGRLASLQLPLAGCGPARICRTRAVQSGRRPLVCFRLSHYVHRDRIGARAGGELRQSRKSNGGFDGSPGCSHYRPSRLQRRLERALEAGGLSGQETLSFPADEYFASRLLELSVE